MVNSKQSSLKYEHVQDMFRVFVTNGVTEVETRVFFEFLTKQNSKSKNHSRQYVLDE